MKTAIGILLALASLAAGAIAQATYPTEPESLYLYRIGGTLAANFEGEYIGGGGTGVWTNGAGRHIALDGTSSSPFSVWLRLRDSGPSGTVRGNGGFSGIYSTYIVAPTGGSIIAFLAGPSAALGDVTVDTAALELLAESSRDWLETLTYIVVGIGLALPAIYALERIFPK